jgi:sugar-specific transcriptional regulator TrmB
LIVLAEAALKKILKDFGITETEAEIYLFLAKHGTLKGTEIAKQVKKDKAQIYHILKSLRTKGLVESTLEAPVRFTPVPFESVVESAIKTKREEATRIESTKQELFDYWKNLGKTKIDLPLEKFQVIEGANKIYSKIIQIVGQTKKQLSTVTTVAGLLEAYQFGVFDEINNHPLKANIEFRYLTELLPQNLNLIKTMLAPMSVFGLNIKGRNPNAGLKLSPQMVIRDDEEALFFMSPRTGESSIREDVCLWTNSRTLVQAFVAVFEDLWNSSTEITKKIAELETGMPAPKSVIYKTIESAQKKFEELTIRAKNEMIILTSASRLDEFLKSQAFMSLAKKGISVKIMAPIVRENSQTADVLSRLFEVKHVALNYWETTLVDGKYLLQVNSQALRRKDNDIRVSFGNSFYSDDAEAIEETKVALNEIWKNAQPLSNDTLQSTEILGPPIFPLPENNFALKLSGTILDVKPPGALTEKDVISKIINAKKIVPENPAKNPSRMYASLGIALLHPPESFKLPNIMILAYHVDKHSSYGAEDYLVVYQQLEGKSYFLPVSVAGDNPGAREVFREVFKGTPAENNHTLFNKDEIEIRVHGNTMFAAWATPIPLFPKSLALPPACMQVEGYGNVKTIGYSSVAVSGFRHEVEQNYFDAFVTFFHPNLKYSGPGTDGAFCRDLIITNIPPGAQ